jgi:hypothetical protein
MTEQLQEVKRLKTGGRQIGTSNKKTVLLKELGLDKYQDLFNRLLVEYVQLLEHEDIRVKLIAMKELSRIMFNDSFPRRTKALLNEDSGLSYDIDLL